MGLKQIKQSKLLARYLSPSASPASHGRRDADKQVKSGTNLMSLFLIFLLIAGIATTVYALIKKDFSVTLLGLGVMLYSLITVFIIVRVKKRAGKSAHQLHHPAQAKVKKQFKKHFKKGMHPWIALARIIAFIATAVQKMKKNKHRIAFFFFVLFGLVAGWYFWYVEEDVFLVGISALICLIALIAIARNMHAGRREGAGGKETRERSAWHGAGRVGETIAVIGSSEVERLRRVVKEKIDTLEKGKTPLDVLYWLLEEKRQIKLRDIAKIFSIEIKKAEEWAKILEAHELAEINYPAFGPPELKLKKAGEVGK